VRRTAFLICMAIGVLAATETALAGAPTATTGAASAVTGNTATISGTVFPNKEDTNYFFEWGTTTAYGTKTPTGVERGNADKTVAADLTGLAPQTTYHFRLVAENPSGRSEGADATFTTTAGGPAPPPAATIAATPPKVTFGAQVTIAGQITGEPAVSVELQHTPFPFSDPFRTIVEGTTDASAAYSFFALPTVNTRYRVRAKASPPVETGELTVLVRPKVGLRLSDRTPAIGQRVRFRGSVLPAHDGSEVKIQRRTSAGWTTIRTPTLAAATPVGGVARSKYRASVRIRRNAAYRTVLAKHDDHARGKSGKKRAVVH
jgi:hypothetical protein